MKTTRAYRKENRQLWINAYLDGRVTAAELDNYKETQRRIKKIK